jgi:molybdopterin-guanine dinucleotide biosynthesis protein A
MAEYASDQAGAIILAGGQSRRMGQNKALLRLTPDGPRLIERVIAAARPITATIVISTNTPALYSWLGLPCVADAQPGMGPLAGLAAGLAAVPTEYAFLLGCDMPFVVTAVLRALLGVAAGAQAVVPRNAADRPEPLCAVYRRDCLPTIQSCLANGDVKMTAWLDRVNTRYVPASALLPFDPKLQSFRNVNTPEDLAT